MNNKANGKFRLSITFGFLVVLGGLTMIASASAQTVMTNDLPSRIPSPARALPAPASNRLVLSTAGGKVRILDSKGLLLESNMVYLPRIQISDLSDADLYSLLETKTAYAALTSFGPLSERNAQSVVIENQLRQVWLQGKSLAEKIKTRLQLLDEMRAYNADLAFLPGLVMGANRAATRASLVDEGSAFKNQAATNAANGLVNAQDARAMGDASHGQVYDARLQYEAANESAVRADNRAAAADYRAAVENQSLQNYLDACATILTNLAAYGISVPASPPFSPVPPLSMKPEINAERLAGRSQ
jgi:hypothetical protein